MSNIYRAHCEIEETKRTVDIARHDAKESTFRNVILEESHPIRILTEYLMNSPFEPCWQLVWDERTIFHNVKPSLMLQCRCTLCCLVMGGFSKAHKRITNTPADNLSGYLGGWQANGSDERIMNEDVRVPRYEIRLRYIKWIPIAHFILSVASASACYAVALANKHVTIYLPLLSETGDASTQRIIFIIAGVFISNITALMVVIKYLILRYYLCCDRRYWQLQNISNCIIGLFSMSCLIIIVGFPASSEVATHTAVAALYFVTILIYTCLDCFITFHVVCTNPQVSPDLILYHLAQYYWKNHNWKRPALKRPEDKGFWLMFIACVTEWVILIALILYFLLFSVDFASFNIVMQGVPATASLSSIRAPDPERNAMADENAPSTSNPANEPKPAG
ncbi:hypothetical protein AVEN_117576-1 [Araneus ventricosus]|uniref:CWH43-like N-terminal domain-containing protein n=1 Tax=Araneus ventricosus TaxID=182803 RepID=A0A4Y2MXF9_ARAVE|nr:hypothetical protein AVEN_272571-1 [Araneus ventricosus]GBN31230.1 hypothetical protein AVEN_117576-1 [Araneus ventricosus]